jgi:hypothetical protein
MDEEAKSAILNMDEEAASTTLDEEAASGILKIEEKLEN